MEHRDEGEGYGGGGDRDNLHLGGPHPVLWPMDAKPARWIDGLAAANPNLIVVLNVGGAVLEPALEKAKGLVYSFYPGQAGGTALAKLLFGDTNFSGKLPFSIAAAAGDYPAFGNSAATAMYEYNHGYRKLDADKKVPRHYFGAGQSYTRYEYSNLATPCADGVEAGGALVATVDVKNAGARAGTEIVQLYVGYPNTKVRRPPRELKAFTRVDLAPGQTKTVTLAVPAKDLAYYDMAGKKWTLEGVEHEVQVGPSADPRGLLKKPFTVKGN
jgi:beta-glucosidase